MKRDVTKEGMACGVMGGKPILQVTIPNPGEIIDFMQPGKTYELTIKRKRQKRSLNANAYYWELVGKLANALMIRPQEIYKAHISGLGTYYTIEMPEEAVPRFAKDWNSAHYGRFIDTREARSPGQIIVLAYYGSSDFNAKEMSALIDQAIQDCHAMGIETRPQEEVDALLAQWDAQTDESIQDSGQS